MLCFRLRAYLPDGRLSTSPSVPTGWTHIVLNYRGQDIEGIIVYYDGTAVVSGTTKTGGPFSAGDGRIVVGRLLTHEDEYYATVQMDELNFFNQVLSDEEVQSIYNSV